MKFEPDLAHGLGILQGWRQIAQHIGKSERTARRWYDKLKMPIRHHITGRPFAFIHELDKWMLVIDDLLKDDPDPVREERCRGHMAMMRACKKGNVKKAEESKTGDLKNYPSLCVDN
jgi:hypothetical protein